MRRMIAQMLSHVRRAGRREMERSCVLPRPETFSSAAVAHVSYATERERRAWRPWRLAERSISGAGNSGRRAVRNGQLVCHAWTRTSTDRPQIGKRRCSAERQDEDGVCDAGRSHGRPRPWRLRGGLTCRTNRGA